MTTYQRACEEFEFEDDNEKHKLIYAYFGLAVYQAQVIEQSFANMLWMNRVFKRKVKSQAEIDEIVDSIENSKKSMGNLINELKTEYIIENDVQIDLKDILERRNYLAHKFFKDNIQKFHSEIGQKECLEYFSNFIDNAKDLDEKLLVYYEGYQKRLGFTPEKMEELMEEMRVEELMRVNKGSQV